MAGTRDQQAHRGVRAISPRCGMSLEAMSWALTQAPGVPPECVSLLIGLANHADSLGRGAYAGQKLLASYARKTDRSARNDLAKLLSIGLIRHGDQKLAAHIPADCRPVVYDLALERKCASARKQGSARQSASSATTDRFAEAQASDQPEREGSGSTLPGGSEVPGGNEASRERKPASDKPTTNQEPKNSPTESSAGKSKAARATRLPDDFAITDAMREWADREVPALIASGRARREHDKFCNHFRAASGANARKTDWVAAWRNWMLRAEDELPGHGQGHSRQPPRGRQAETDELFDRAMQRAQAREESHDATRDGHPGQVRQGALPAAGN